MKIGNYYIWIGKDVFQLGIQPLLPVPYYVWHYQDPFALSRGRKTGCIMFGIAFLSRGLSIGCEWNKPLKAYSMD